MFARMLLKELIETPSSGAVSAKELAGPWHHSRRQIGCQRRRVAWCTADPDQVNTRADTPGVTVCVANAPIPCGLRIAGSIPAAPRARYRDMTRPGWCATSASLVAKPVETIRVRHRTDALMRPLYGLFPALCKEATASAALDWRFTERNSDRYSTTVSADDFDRGCGLPSSLADNNNWRRDVRTAPHALTPRPPCVHCSFCFSAFQSRSSF